MLNLTNKKEESDLRWCCLNRSYTRFLVLGVLTLVTVLYTAVFIVPSSLESIIESTLEIKTSQFEYIFTCYTIASVLSCLTGGVLTDKYLGIRTGSIVFGLIALLGECLVSLGAFFKAFWLILVGRFVLGCGIECLAVILNCYAVIWFENNELGFAFAFFLMLGKGLATSLTFLVAEPLYDFFKEHVKQNLVLGFTMTPFLLSSFLLILLLFVLGKLSYVCNKDIENVKNMRKINVKQIVKFPKRYWVFLSMLTFSMVSVMVLMPCFQKLVSLKFSLSSEEANHLSTVFNFGIALLSPTFGLIIGRIGFCLYFALFGILIGISSFLVFLYAHCSPYIFLMLFTIYISTINCCAWNLVVLIVDEYQQATAYGMLALTIHLMTTIFNLLVGYVLQAYGADAAATIILSCCSKALVSVCILIVCDKRTGGLLNMSASKSKEKK